MRRGHPPSLLALLALLPLAGACRCNEEAPSPTRVTPAASESSMSSMPPATPPVMAASGGPPGPTTDTITGWFCPDEGPATAAPTDAAFKRGPWWVGVGTHWQYVTDDGERFLDVRGMKDTAAATTDGAFFSRRWFPRKRTGVLIAKEHELPEGMVFDQAHVKAIFDEIAADPQASMMGTRLVKWGGRPVIEGAVVGTNQVWRHVVHHRILPLEGRKALVVTFISDDKNFHNYLGEACAALSIAK